MDEVAEAEAYARADFAEVNEAFVRRLLELAPAERANALDLGTGPGDIPIRMARRRPKWLITAVDASAAMIALAWQAVREARLTETIWLVQADAKATPLKAGAYDVVFSNSILHHVSDMPRFWAEFRRLAAPGAAVLLRDLCRPASEGAARRIVRTYAAAEPDLLQEEYYRSLLAAWTVEEIRRQLEQAGITTLQVAMASDRHFDVFGRLG